MEIITDLGGLKNSSFQNLVLAVGNFDGVHLGHQALLGQIQKKALELGARAAVFTFREHPQRVLHAKEEPPILTSLIHKLVLLQRAGLDLCILADFTEPFSQMSPEDFVKNILLDTLGAREICMGSGARFGRGRSGDRTLVERLAGQYGFHFFEAPAVTVQGAVISSTLIRNLIRDGKLTEAGGLLGRPYSFFGTVTTGDGRGRTIGFPTVNLDPHSEVMPPEGVYAVWFEVLDLEWVQVTSHKSVLKEGLKTVRRQAVLNYGRRPTFGDGGKAIPEAHILDFDGNLDGKTVEVTFGPRLRSEQRFSSAETLKRQIQEDIRAARKSFQLIKE